MRNSYNPGVGTIPNNAQTYSGYDTHRHYSHPIGVLGYSYVPPAYTQTKDFRKEEKRGLRIAKKEARGERKLAKRGGNTSYYPHSNLPLADGPGTYRNSRASYSSNNSYYSDDEYHRQSRLSHQPYGGLHAAHSTYWDPAGRKGISIEPCPCTDPNFPYGPVPMMGAPIMTSPMMISSPMHHHAPVYQSRPIFDNSIYQPHHHSSIRRSSYMPTDERLLPSSRVGGHYGLIAPATNPYQPLYSPANPIDWRKTAGL